MNSNAGSMAADVWLRSRHFCVLDFSVICPWMGTGIFSVKRLEFLAPELYIAINRVEGVHELMRPLE